MVPRLKVCGVNSQAGLRACLDAGVDAIGFNLARGPRRISPEQAAELSRQVPPFVTLVALVMDQPAALCLELVRAARCHVVQLHGHEAPEIAAFLLERMPVIKAFTHQDAASTIQAYPCSAVLLDAPAPAGVGGGTGKTWDWSLARALAGSRPWILAGGLRPDNVAEAIRIAQPYGVDVASGVERGGPGQKDPELCRAFVKALRS